MLYVVGNASSDFRDYCAQHGITYGKFSATAQPGDDLVVPIDMTNRQALRASLDSLASKPDVDALFVSGFEHYVLPAAWLADYFKVPGCSVEAAARATDKLLMRQAFQTADPSITPDFSTVDAWEAIEAFLQNHSFPVMLKPANLMKSLYITKNDSLDELRANYQQLQAGLPATYQKYRLGQPRVIIEEFLAGTMHTVAGFVDAEGQPRLIEQIVDCVMARDIGMPDSYLFSRRLPSNLPADAQQSCLQVAEQAVRSLGVTSTAVHVELMYTASGPKVIEIGARLGGYRPKMYQLAYGIDLYKATLQTAHAESVDLQATKSPQAVSVIELFPAKVGVFGGPPDEAELQALASLQSVHWKYQPGETIGPAANGYRATAIITLAHDEYEQVQADEAWLSQYQILVAD